MRIPNHPEWLQGRPKLLVLAICLLLAFVLYGNSLRNQYCLDDAIVITHNQFTKAGFKGLSGIFTKESFTGFFGEQKSLVAGARYRPLSIASFAIEQGLTGGNPFVSHLINLLLYALTGFLLFMLLYRMVQGDADKKIIISGMVVLLYLFQPVHTEVVANIKGRDEILAFLLSLYAAYLMLRAAETRKNSWLIAGSFVWFLALMSKENAVVFILLIPFVIWLAGYRNRKQLLYTFLSLSVAAFIFFVVRQLVIGGIFTSTPDELLNNSYLNASPSEKYATIVYSLGRYIQLLLFPHPLTYDYYPYHIHLTGWGNPYVWVALFVYAAMLFLIVVNIRKKPWISFGLLLYLLPLILVSNLFFPVGTMMSERFIYISSAGFLMVIVSNFYDLSAKYEKLKPLLFGLTTVVLLVFGWLTIQRNTVWYNDYTLFTTDVHTSFDSAKSNCSAGGVLLESMDTIADAKRKYAVLGEAVACLHRSLAIHPKYNDAWLLLGNAYYREANPDSALLCYSRILDNFPGHKLAMNNLRALVSIAVSTDKKIGIYKSVLHYLPGDMDANYKLGVLYGMEKNDPVKSVVYLEKALAVNPQSKNILMDLGVAFALMKDYRKSAAMLERALALDPTNTGLLNNLGITYHYLGEESKAREYFARAEALKKKLPVN